MNIIIKKIIFGKLYCAVEHTKVNETPAINYLFLKKKKDELLKEKEGSCTAFSDLIKEIPKGQHIFLSINNEHVISKTLDENLEPAKAIQKAFPNLNAEDFYFETYQNELKTYISLCRKEHVKNMIEQYEKEGFHIINFSLGNLVAAQLLPYITDSKLYTSNACLYIENKNLMAIEKNAQDSQEEYTINDLTLTNKSVLGLAGILNYYSGQTLTDKSFEDETNALHNNFVQKNIFGLGLKVGLAFIFILLLSNFLIYSHYRDQVTQIQSDIEIGMATKQNLLVLSNEVDKKKKIIDEISASEGSKISLYLDKIGASIPQSVLLTQLNFQPITKNIKPDKEILYQDQIVIIKGKSNQGKEFSKWIASMEQEPWIDTIAVINYGTGKKVITEFELKITLKS